MKTVIFVFCVVLSLVVNASASTWREVLDAKLLCEEQNPSCTCSTANVSGNVYDVNRSCPGTGYTTRSVICLNASCSGSAGWSWGGAGNSHAKCDGTTGSSSVGESYYNNSSPPLYHYTEVQACSGAKSYTSLTMVGYGHIIVNPCPTSGDVIVNGGCTPVVTLFGEYQVESCDHPELVAEPTGGYSYTSENCDCVPSGLFPAAGSGSFYIGCIGANGTECKIQSCYFTGTPAAMGAVVSGQTLTVGQHGPVNIGGIIYDSVVNADGTITYTSTIDGVTLTNTCTPDLQHCEMSMTNEGTGVSTHVTTNDDGLKTTETYDPRTDTDTTAIENPDGTTTTIINQGDTSNTTIINNDGSVTHVGTDTHENHDGETGQTDVTTTTTTTTVNSDGTGTTTRTETETVVIPTIPGPEFSSEIPTGGEQTRRNISGLVQGFINNNPVSAVIRGSGVSTSGAVCMVGPITIFSASTFIDFCKFESWLNTLGIINLAWWTFASIMYVFRRGDV